MDGSSSSNGNPSKNGKGTASEIFMDNLRKPKRGVGTAKLEKMRAEEEMKQRYYLQEDPSSRAAHISGPAGIQIQRMISYGTNGNISGSGLILNNNVTFDSRPPSTSGAASEVNPSPSNTDPRTLQFFPDHKAPMDRSSSSNNGNPSRNGKRTTYLRERKRGVGIAKLEKMMAEEEMKQKYYLQADPFTSRAAHTSGAASCAKPSYTEPSAVSPGNMEPTTLQLLPDHMEDENAHSKREGDHNISVEPTRKNSNNPEDLDLGLKL